MQRRTFLASAAGAAAVTGSSCRPARDSQTTAAKALVPFELDELDITQLAAGLRAGKWTTARLVELYLARTDAIDRAGPRLAAVLEVNQDAAALARELDGERRAGHLRSPLHGVPILVKDNLETAGGMSTSGGSLALAEWRAPKDAFVVGRLRAAGALILGKTNLSEWANFRSTHSSSGWSGRGGQTRNPYALHRNPSGSSSGSGVAVAANLSAAAVGTETDGSVVGPASVNGIVGIKPTLGLLSRSGIIPLSHSQDTPGPMTRTVRDAAWLLGAMSGVDPDDPATAAQAGKVPTDYTRFLDPAGLRGARIGVARKFFEKNAPLDRFLTQCVAVLQKAGAVVVDPADLPGFGKWDEPELEVLLYEFRADLNAYLAKLPATLPARSLAELIAFNEKSRDREMPWFEQEIFQMAAAKGPLTERKYLDARRLCLELTRKDGIDAVLAQHKLDAIVSLSSGPAWPTDWVSGDHDTGNCTSPAAIAGYPHITVPAGLVQDLPVGLSFFGAAWSEPVLLRLAFAYETTVQARRKPLFLEGIELPKA